MINVTAHEALDVSGQRPPNQMLTGEHTLKSTSMDLKRDRAEQASTAYGSTIRAIDHT